VKFLIDLRWARSQTLDGIGRVSLCLMAELLRMESPHIFGLLFANAERAEFGLAWIRNYDTRPIKATYRVDRVGIDARSPLNRVVLPQRVRQFQPDLYFTPYYPFHPPAGIPCMGMVHDLIPLRYPEYFREASLPFRLLMTHATPLQLLLQSCQKIITVSQSSAQDLQQMLGISPTKIQVVYPGVQVFQAHPNPQEVLHRFRLPLNKPFILGVGRPEPYKNFQGLIQSYARLPKPLREAHPLVLVGPAHPLQTPALEDLIQRQGLTAFVHLTGAVAAADLPAFYQGAALFAFPSLYEGFGLPVLEAMAAGLPVLSSNRASLPEAAGDAAILHDPEDREGWARQIEKLLKNPALCQTLREKGKAHAAKFSWQRMAEGILKELETVGAQA